MVNFHTHPLGFIFMLFSSFLFFCLGSDPFNKSFYCTKFYFPFNYFCKYLDFMLVLKDKLKNIYIKRIIRILEEFIPFSSQYTLAHCI